MATPAGLLEPAVVTLAAGTLNHITEDPAVCRALTREHRGIGVGVCLSVW